MTDVFGNHRLEIPYSSIADLLAQYRRRDPDKLAIVGQHRKGHLASVGPDVWA